MQQRLLIDDFGRQHTNLRISVTDRCNIRCFYCMPDENVQFHLSRDILTFAEIERFARVLAQWGINRLRITGGEPLVRADLPDLVARLVRIGGICDVALTTNGMLLEPIAQALRDAGLHRLNISLDTLDAARFEQISRRPGLDRVLAGIFAAQRAGFDRIRLNAVAIQGLTESDVVPLGEFARQHGLEMRFIEFMPLDAEGNWQAAQVLSGAQIRVLLERAFGPLLPTERLDPHQPATDYEFADGRGRVGFINPISEPFCAGCNRLRLTADGKVRNCLFSNQDWDARTILRGGGSDDQLADLVARCVSAKRAGHGIQTADFVPSQRAMYQIGG